MPLADHRGKLTATVGAACCAILLTGLPRFEGTVLRGYKDPIGIVTACTGHTKTAVLGRAYTPAECESLLVDDTLEHAKGVGRCVPLETLSVGQRAAAISFAFNVGVANFCRSTFARKLKAHATDACAELSKWIYAGPHVLAGLVKRRATERAMCEGRMQ